MLIVGAAIWVRGQLQEADPSFDAKVVRPAYTVVHPKVLIDEAECDEVRDWVRDGGSLLLIADHAPIGGANEILSKRFGVEMSKMHTFDKAHANLKNGGNAGWIIYSRENGLLGEHPITQGRDATERINSVTAFTGQSLKGPEGSAVFLRVADTAVDYDAKRLAHFL